MTAFASGRSSAPAIIEASTGASLTYAELDAETRRIGRTFGESPSLHFHFAANSLHSIVTFLGARTAGHAVALLDPALKPELAERLIALYEPAHVTGATAPVDGASYVQVGPGHWTRKSPRLPVVNPDLAVLLSTSGSTGSPKFVRLSARGVEHNARAIARSLHLEPSDRAFASLPLHYSYGMSVLTSHLAVGATVIVSDASVVEQRFCEEFRAHGATSLRRGALHLRDAGPTRVPGSRATGSAGDDPGRRPPSRTPPHQVPRRALAAGCPLLRDVRPDRSGPPDVMPVPRGAR